MMRPLACTLALMAVAVHAAPEFDPLALSIDDTPAASTPATALGLTAELAWQALTQRNPTGTATPATQALTALDLRHDWAADWLASDVRATVSARLEQTRDIAGNTVGGEPEARFALREAFLSHRDTRADGSAMFFDAGRINLRLGVATGYNPTDAFRHRATLSGLSQNPASQRQNRLGVFTVRTQWLRPESAWTAAWVPRLTDRDDTDTRDFALGLERTNRQQAWLLRWTPQLGERFSLDTPLVVRAGRTEAGLNATALLTDALVATVEASSARREGVPDLASALAGHSGPDRRGTRWAAGGTWTLPSGIAITVERHHADDALSAPAWRTWREALARSAPARAAYGRLAADLAARQDMLVRDAWFARLAWDDAFSYKGLALAAQLRRNAQDGSGSWQTEAAWNDRRDWSLRLIAGGHRGHGHGDSEYGLRTLKRYVALTLSLYW